MNIDRSYNSGTHTISYSEYSNLTAGTQDAAFKAAFDKYYTWVAVLNVDGDAVDHYVAEPKYNAISALANKLSGKWTPTETGVFNVRCLVTNGEKKLTTVKISSTDYTVYNDKYTGQPYGSADGAIKI